MLALYPMPQNNSRVILVAYYLQDGNGQNVLDGVQVFLVLT